MVALCQVLLVFATFFSNIAGKEFKAISHLIRTNSDIAVNCSIPSSKNDQWKWYHNKDLDASAVAKCRVEADEPCGQRYNGILFSATKNFTELSISSANLTNAGSYTCMDGDARVEITHQIVIVDDIQIIINDHEVNDGVLDILRNGSLEGACLVTFNNSKAPLPIVKISNGICENNETETGEGTIVMGFLCSNFTDSFNLTCSVGMENVEDELEERVEVKIHYCPEKVEFFGHQHRVMQVGGNLTCRVRANHKVDVEWLLTKSIPGHNEASFAVTKKDKYVCRVKASKSSILGYCPGFNVTFDVLNVTEVLSSNQQKSGCPTCKAVKSGSHFLRPPLNSILFCLLVILKKFQCLE